MVLGQSHHARPAALGPRGAVRAIVMIMLMGLLTGCGAGSSSDGGETGFVGGEPGLTTVAPADRKPAPEVAGETLDGATLALADLRGKVVVINVWGSWCGPCKAEIGDLVRAANATADVAAFVGINTQDTGRAQAQAFVRAHQVPYPSLYDPTGQQLVKFAGTLPPQAIPSTLVIDADGRMAARVIGVVSERTLVGLVDDVSSGS